MLANQEVRKLGKSESEALVVSVVGPAPALVVRQHNKYHFHIVLKYPKGYEIEKLLREIPSDWTIDRNPYSIV